MKVHSKIADTTHNTRNQIEKKPNEKSKIHKVFLVRRRVEIVPCLAFFQAQPCYRDEFIFSFSTSLERIANKKKSAKIMLYIIGIGLCDEKDITLRGLEAVKSSDEVFLEAYTSILSVGADALSVSTPI